jgi:two-component SAPR family response regulator
MRVEANTLLAEGRAKHSAALRIGLLGGFTVTVGDRKVDESAWRLRKAASLVKLLALASGHRLHRERAMDLLWPGAGVTSRLQQPPTSPPRRPSETPSRPADRFALPEP